MRGASKDNELIALEVLLGIDEMGVENAAGTFHYSFLNFRKVLICSLNWSVYNHHKSLSFSYSFRNPFKINRLRLS